MKITKCHDNCVCRNKMSRILTENNEYPIKELKPISDIFFLIGQTLENTFYKWKIYFHLERCYVPYID